LRGELDRLRVDLDEMTNPDSADKPAKRPPDKRLKGRTKGPAKAQVASGRPKGGGGSGAVATDASPSASSGSPSLTIGAGSVDPIAIDQPTNGDSARGKDDRGNPH
jgi:hypothetical protein